MNYNMLLVYSSPRKPELDQAYNDFFDFFYTQCMLRIPGVVASTRYRLCHQQMEWILPASREPQWPFGQEHTYLTKYDVDPAVPADELLAGLRESRALSMVRNPEELPVAWGKQWLYEPITTRETSARLKPDSGASDLSPTHIWMVPNSPLSEEVEEANNHWYTTQSNLQYTGFEAVTRYRLAQAQQPERDADAPPALEWPHGRHTQLALWELSDLLTAMRHRRSAYEAGASFPSYSWIPPIRELRKADDHVIYEALTNRVTSIWV